MAYLRARDLIVQDCLAGSYARCIRLRRETEPQIWDATRFGTLLEISRLNINAFPLRRECLPRSAIIQAQTGFLVPGTNWQV
jgi:hypothetical protein